MNNYIRDSKRPLTVRRNNKKFHYIWKLGCDTVVRKDDIRIHLDSYGLDMPKHRAYTYYANEHEQLCVELTRTILDKVNHRDLLLEPGLGKAQFATRLEEMP